MTDLTTNTRPRTIRLGQPGVRFERPASATITPGSLVRLKSDGTFIPYDRAGKRASAQFAVEQELFGKGIDDDYVSGDLVQTEVFKSGDRVLAFLAADAAAVVEGDLLQPAGDGSVQITGTDYAEACVQALESVDNSAGSSIARIMVMVL